MDLLGGWKDALVGECHKKLWVRDSSRQGILVGMTERDGHVSRSLFALDDRTRPSYRCKMQIV